MKHASEPYLSVIDSPRRMSGKGAPMPTVFGVLGRMQVTPEMKTLGGLVVESTHGVNKKEGAESVKSIHKNSDRSILGSASKTHISGQHFGQVPYPGRYMADLGSRL